MYKGGFMPLFAKELPHQNNSAILCCMLLCLVENCSEKGWSPKKATKSSLLILLIFGHFLWSHDLFTLVLICCKANQMVSHILLCCLNNVIQSHNFDRFIGLKQEQRKDNCCSRNYRENFLKKRLHWNSCLISRVKNIENNDVCYQFSYDLQLPSRSKGVLD